MNAGPALDALVDALTDFKAAKDTLQQVAVEYTSHGADPRFHEQDLKEATEAVDKARAQFSAALLAALRAVGVEVPA